MLRPALLALVVSSLAFGQGTIFIPDNQSNVGTCNAIPLSASFASSSTYLARIPASFMNPLLKRVDDIAFAPCATTTWSASSAQMGMGHVPTPLPVPFTFPTFDGAGNVTALGSFLDYQPIWNSVSQGALTYVMTLDTWSPMGFATLGGTGFTWNGTNDVGFFLTFTGAAGGNSCHRTSTEPFRCYASGTYQAAASSGSGAAGLKMELFVSPSASITPVGTGCPGALAVAPVLSTTELPLLGNAAFHVDVSQGYGNAISYLYLSIGMGPPVPIGGGCNVYLDVPSALQLISINFCPIGPTFLDGAGNGVFGLGIPNNPGFSGYHVGFQATVADPGAVNGFTLTNALEGILN